MFFTRKKAFDLAKRFVQDQSSGRPGQVDPMTSPYPKDKGKQLQDLLNKVEADVRAQYDLNPADKVTVIPIDKNDVPPNIRALLDGLGAHASLPDGLGAVGAEGGGLGIEKVTAPVTSGRDTLPERLHMGDVFDEVHEELLRAVAKFPAFNSGHEGYAVLKEEVEELWHEIKNNRGSRGPARTEAIQVAAMALRYVINVCDNVKDAPLPK